MTFRDVEARLAQPAERKALNLVVVGSSPTVGVWDIVGNSMCAPRPTKLSPIMVAPLHSRPDHILLPGLSRFSCHENLQGQVDVLLAQLHSAAGRWPAHQRCVVGGRALLGVRQLPALLQLWYCFDTYYQMTA